MTRARKRSRGAASPRIADDSNTSAVSATRPEQRRPVHVENRRSGRGPEAGRVAASVNTTLQPMSDALSVFRLRRGRKRPRPRQRAESRRCARTQEIAVVLDLPSSAFTAENGVQRSSSRRASQLSSTGASAPARGGIRRMLIGAASLRKPAAPTLPEALLGGWITTNPAYQGRELGFVESELVMRVTPDAPLTRYPITAMSSRTASDTTVLGLTYVTEGGPVELHARLIGGRNPTWFRAPSVLVCERDGRTSDSIAAPFVFAAPLTATASRPRLERSRVN